VKKLIASIILLLNMSLLSAQLDNTDSFYKYDRGDANFELSINPGSIFGDASNPAIGFVQNLIKYRKFTGTHKAFRAGIGLGFINHTRIIQEANSEANLLELKSKQMAYTLSFMPGFEKHFEGTARLSPYVGTQFLLSYTYTSLQTEYQLNDKIYTITYTNVPVDEGGLGAGAISAGIGLVAGFDYYFAKKLYLGVEFGIGLEYGQLLKSSLTDSYDHENDVSVKHGSMIELSPSLSTSGLRLGWVF